MKKIKFIVLIPFLISIGLTDGIAQNNSPFSLKEILSAPVPLDGVVSPDYEKFAWVMNDEGVRNIWFVEAPGFKARKLTHYTKDKGRGIGDLEFTADGENLLYVLGGSANQSGEYPNPTHNPDGGIQEIHMVSISEDQTKKLADGSSPVASPTENICVFSKGERVFSINLETEQPEAKQLFQIRGGAGKLEWSPDGEKLAFVSYRSDHSYIGIYDIENESINYINPSVDMDDEPVWSEDGNQIAYIRKPRQTQIVPYFTPLREGLPWSIWIHDFTTGEDRQVWKANSGQGSIFHEIYAEKQLLWGANDVLIFPWEKNGWSQLYSVSVEDGNVTHLTPGQHEVFFPSLSPDKEEVFYASNLDDIDRRHIWKVNVEKSNPGMLTKGDGLEWGPMVLKNDHIVFAASTGTVPAHVEVMSPNGERQVLATADKLDNFPSEKITPPRQVIFPAADGMRIHGQLFLPKNYDENKKYPAVLFFHGGSRRQMMLGFHNSNYYHNCYSFNQYLANNGYIVLSVNFRSGIGYGMKFREAENFGAAGASEFYDVLGAGNYLQNRNDVKADNIGLWGGSYGGYLTALGLARASHLFKAGVDIHGVHDWNVVIKHFSSEYDPLKYKDQAETAFRASPMASIDDWRSPVLVIHGDDDRNVPFSETVDLVEKLRKRDVEIEQLVFPDEVHGFIMHEHWFEAFKRSKAFFDKQLKK
ncbi:MAG: prolyl oligopeptidase family serine peptidase [Bacteroidales bacterium]